MKRSPGFTLIETLVLVGIVLLLLALLAPGLQFARERARQARCRNNLKQIGVALNAYHDAHKVFPPGIIHWAEPDREYVLTPAARKAPGAGGTSGFTLLLPFLEYEEAYATYNFDSGCLAAANVTAGATTIDALLCPSNPRGSDPVSIPAYARPPAPTDYVFSLGGNGLITSEPPFRPTTTAYLDPHYPSEMKLGVGPFNVDSSATMRWFKDGASNTFMIGEGAGGLARGRYNGSDFGGEIPNQAHTGAVVDQAWSQGFLGTRDGVGGYGSVFAATAFDASYVFATLNLRPANQFTPLPMNMHARGMNLMRGTTFEKTLPFSPYPERNPFYASALDDVSVSPFRSLHPGMCHFLFADGAVQAIAEDIDPRIYVGLSSVAGKEEIEKWGWSTDR